MDSQQALRWEESALDGLWSIIPGEHRECVVAMLGHLIAQAARAGALVHAAPAPASPEDPDEPAAE